MDGSLRKLSLAFAALLASACGGGGAGPCKPGGDGSYLTQPYATLDQYCLVSLQAGEVQYQQGVVPYELNTPLFSDYAIKRRAVFVPAGKSANYAAAADLDTVDFPLGTVITKTFGFPDDFTKSNPAIHWVETRVLLRAADGWHAYPYLWDAAQKVATYSAGGGSVPVSFVNQAGTQSFTYQVPTQNQCKQCHESNGDLVPIGPKVRNLNRDYAYASGSENQLVHWTKAGILSGAPADPTQAPRLTAWDDTAQTVEKRARAYLEVNCAHCHNPSGNASPSGLFLFASGTDPLHFGVCKEPLSAGPGAGGLSWDIVPGDPDHSILHYRVGSSSPGVMMPALGRTLVHQEGLALVTAWIQGLPSKSCP
jgi:uncharacterized repeat protein (TIGR03806 family)